MLKFGYKCSDFWLRQVLLEPTKCPDMFCTFTLALELSFLYGADLNLTALALFHIIQVSALGRFDCILQKNSCLCVCGSMRLCVSLLPWFKRGFSNVLCQCRVYLNVMLMVISLCALCVVSAFRHIHTHMYVMQICVLTVHRYVICNVHNCVPLSVCLCVSESLSVADCRLTTKTNHRRDLT